MTKNVMQIQTRQEKELFREWKTAVRKHGHYVNKKKYYPYRMDEWEQESKDIDASYRGQLHDMISARQMEEKERSIREVELEAAETLLLLKKRANQQKARKEVREEMKNMVVRRSSRIANQNNMYDCSSNI